MAPQLPPLFGAAPSRLCTRWLAGRNCGAAPVMHVLWNAETMDNGIVCAAHVVEIGSLWAFAQTHEIGPDCGMPGACWHFDENVCRCPGELLTNEDALVASSSSTTVGTCPALPAVKERVARSGC